MRPARRLMVSGGGSGGGGGGGGTGALHFPGTAPSEAKISNTAFQVPAAGFTVALWFRCTGNTGLAQTLVSMGGPPGWRVAVAPDTTTVNFYATNGGGTNYPAVAAAISLNTWYFFVGANTNTGLDSTNLPYSSLNGAAKQAGPHATGGPMSTTPDTFALGYDAGLANDYALADIARVGYWARVLTDAEIAALYNGGASLREAQISGTLGTNLVAYYNGDDTAGDNVSDQGGSGLTLIGQNGAATYTAAAGPP